MGSRPGHPSLALLIALSALGCAAAPDLHARRTARSEDYLRYVSFEVPGNEHVLLRWAKRQMPLRVFLPPPPDGLFEDPEAIRDAVRDGVLAWTDVASPGVPSFTFVESARLADVPIVWAREPDGDWYIAYCTFRIDFFSRRFGVDHILVTARRGEVVADIHDIYATMLHEMGHALGLGGHSPDSGDIMHPRVLAEELSERDRATLRALYARPIGTRIANARRLDP